MRIRLMLACAGLVLVGCGAPGGYTLTVARGGQQLAAFDLAALQALPQTRITTPGTGNGGEQDEPGVVAVLEKAGAATFTGVAVTGDEGTRTFTAAEVAGAVLDITNRGTTKFASAGVGQDRWVHNVTTIDVKP
ncbi:hypothetical protein [Pseudonocardia sp. 73-21]|uniref:hypothetical protein n=1 Tax=Pseudonocardia sp. 73-21 TaxID=1895809 RepID=UPI00095DA98C|nr:hypothetical protein [Pseudonocardia sp. 73-21]OJY47282.1 MAG: hypothetical protein BGP03_29915 [Pseudonocardia sp. 73-21]